ncbi:hypothetical protein Nepgr_001705 [Nepenthes gracilis]|uniref:Uncharacterized protein n=1 Tax=Nepenthes gracilis TaxID=150966 RepID=A0AAD3P5G0_NEPGR|nr:hypothetical protein Nepgr_001705 [Nepenthes gracilis]
MSLITKRVRSESIWVMPDHEHPKIIQLDTPMPEIKVFMWAHNWNTVSAHGVNLIHSCQGTMEYHGAKATEPALSDQWILMLDGVISQH